MEVNGFDARVAALSVSISIWLCVLEARKRVHELLRERTAGDDPMTAPSLHSSSSRRSKFFSRPSLRRTCLVPSSTPLLGPPSMPLLAIAPPSTPPRAPSTRSPRSSANPSCRSRPSSKIRSASMRRVALRRHRAQGAPAAPDRARRQRERDRRKEEEGVRRYLADAHNSGGGEGGGGVCGVSFTPCSCELPD